MNKNKRRAKPRWERLADITRLAFFASYDAGNLTWLTASQIANAIGLRNSAHLRGMLDELVDNGALIMDTEDIPGVCGYRGLYAVGDSQPVKDMFQRTIVISSRNGKQEVKING